MLSQHGMYRCHRERIDVCLIACGVYQLATEVLCCFIVTIDNSLMVVVAFGFEEIIIANSAPGSYAHVGLE